MINNVQFSENSVKGSHFNKLMSFFNSKTWGKTCGVRRTVPWKYWKNNTHNGYSESCYPRWKVLNISFLIEQVRRIMLNTFGMSNRDIILDFPIIWSSKMWQSREGLSENWNSTPSCLIALTTSCNVHIIELLRIRSRKLYFIQQLQIIITYDTVV